MASLQFDARQVPPSEAFEPIPAGWYNVVIEESEQKPNSKNDGSYLALTMRVMDGQYANRKLFDRLNLQNPNATAVEIAWKTLSAICHATGVLQIQDSQQLHGIPMQAKVTLRAAGPGTDGKHYEAQNEVKGYRPLEKGSNLQPLPGANPLPPAAPPIPGQGAPTGWTPPPSPGVMPPVAAPPPSQQPPQGWAPPAQTPPPQMAPPQAAPPAWAQQSTPPAAPPPNGAPVQGGSPVPPWARPPGT